MSTGVQPNETPRSSKTSAHSSTLSPPWQPPKTPLAPHRLAKLANALGVSAPIPASLNGPMGSPAFLSRPFSDSSGPPDQFRRSPTPSAASSMGLATPVPSASKFLLHVIPPTHLPHDSDASNDFDMTPPPPSASGYHTQFRRGTLVPVHPTLQGQLGAIAKEYALPSTAGLVLFLVSSGAASAMQSPVSTGMKSPLIDDEFHEPGPRLSEDIWRHLWTRVVQAEQRDGNMLLPPRSPTPLTLSTHSTPFLHQQDLHGNLRPPPSPGLSPVSPRPGYGFGPTTSPPESVSDSLRSNSKSAPPSSATQSEFDSNTPDTSVEGLAIRSDSLDLPGLNSPSLIPILAKVEFDIDRRKANWYEPWLRSRRANHAKRARSRKSSAKSTIGEDVPADAEKAKGKVPAIPLIIGRKETVSPLGINDSDPSNESSGVQGDDAEGLQEAGYEPLSDTQEGDSDSEDDFAEISTARVSSNIENDMKDPLEDVFGSDADTWSDLKQERRATHEINPNIVDLALSAGDLTVTSFNGEDDTVDTSRFTTKEEEEVRDLLDRMSRSSTSSPELDARFSPPASSKKVPPPLVIPPNANLGNVIAAEPSPYPSTAGLAYLDSSPDTGEQLSPPEEATDSRSKSPADSEKRSGALFEDIDLGLDPTDDYDENDPYDRRKSQIMMSAQLDEIEKTLAQLSPRFMKPDLDDDINHSFHSVSANSPSKLTLSPLRSADTSFVSAQLPKHADQLNDSQPGASWPAVPFSHIKDVSSPPSKTNGLSQVPGPPQLALNGVTTAAPPSFNPLAGETSAETVRRKKELEDEEALFRKPSTTDSPVIPLSPDPFGRFSSSPDLQPPRIAEPPDGWDTVTVGQSSVSGDGENGINRMGRARSGTTSRFSVDSIAEGEGPTAAQAPAKSNRGTLMSVKSIKNLWRKSNKGDKEKVEKDKAASSGRMSPAAPQRPERPSQETMDLPDVPPMPVSTSFGRVSPQPGATPDMARRPSQDSSNIPRARSSQGTRPSLDHPQRPSSEIPPPRLSQDAPAPSVPGPPMMAPGLAAPPYASIIRSNSPIIPTQMMGARQNYGLDRLQFDQESPYPNPVRNPPPARYTQQAPPSPPPPSSAPSNMQQQMYQQQQQQQQHYPGLPSIPEQEKLARKSILKWNSTSSNGSHNSPQQQQEHKQRTSFDRASNTSSRTNGSLRSIGSGSGGSYGHGASVGRKTSVNSVSSDLAPPMGMSSSYESTGPLRSPAIPELGTSPPYQRNLGARSVSPAASFASSHASIDESQFEIVSPKLQGGMAYPSVPYGSSGMAS